MSILYCYKYNGLDYYLLDDDKNFDSYPLFKAVDKIKIGDIFVLDYILNAIKIKDEKKALKIKENFLKKDKNNYVIMHKYNGFTYLVFLSSKTKIDRKNLAIFDNDLYMKNELGVFLLNDRLRCEILELDQNLQSAINIDLMLELMEENEDMNKYIELIKSMVKNEDLDEFFFFDDFVYELFIKSFIEVLNTKRIYENNEFIKILGEISE